MIRSGFQNERFVTMNIHDVKYLVVPFEETDSLDSDFEYDALARPFYDLHSAQVAARETATKGKSCVIAKVTHILQPTCSVTEIEK